MVANILLAPDVLDEIVCTFDQFIVPLNLLGVGLGNNEYAKVNKEFLMKSFKQLVGSTEYVLSYLDMGVEINEVGKQCLLVSTAKKMGRKVELYEFVHLCENKIPPTGGEKSQHCIQ